MQWDFKEAGKNKQTNKGIQRTLSGRNEDRKSHLMPKGSLTLKEQQQESLLAATFFFCFRDQSRSESRNRNQGLNIVTNYTRSYMGQNMLVRLYPPGTVLVRPGLFR